MTDSIQEVKARHEKQLIGSPGVVSVGIGKNAAGQTAIIIGIETDSEQTRAALPRELEGYPVEIQTTGPARAQ